MSIVRMKKLRLLAPRGERDALMRGLMRLGCVEVTRQPLPDGEDAARLRPERADLVRLRTEHSRVLAAIQVLERYAPEKKKLLSARPEVRQSEFFDETALRADVALAEKINDTEARIRRLTADMTQTRSQLESLRPWLALGEPFDAQTRTCAVALVSALAQIDAGAIRQAAESVTDAVELYLVSDDGEQHYLAVLGLKEELGAVTDALRAIGCATVSFPELKGTPQENADRLAGELDAMRAECGELTAQLQGSGGYAADLRLTADRLAAELARAEAVERLYGTDSVVLLEGWCPEGALGRLLPMLESHDCAWELSDPSPEEYPDVPVTLKNRRLIEPMTLITEMYSLPAYDGVDPNPLMWPFFVLFYGLMMADMGYGALMMLASVVALRKMRPRGGTKYLLSLLGLCGITTFIFGAMTGGLFGDFVPQLAALIDPGTTLTSLPSLFQPLEDTTMILLGSLALGVVQIFTGMAVSVVYKCRTGAALSALFDEGAWWCILIGAALLVLGYTPVPLMAGGALLVIGQFWEKKSFLGGLTGLFGAIYNGVTGYFSDILSYSRLMALMLAGSVIAMVFNTLGAMTGNIVGFVIIAMVGNALNFALNLLGCFVHDLRLQVLEFFSRFYRDGGRPYQPLNIDPQYVDVIKEEI